MTRTAKLELILFVLLIAHIADHAFNQPARTVPELSGIVGAIGFAVVALAFIVERLRLPRSRELALLAGAGTVAGFTVVHLLGDWTPVSDPYWSFEANPLSWSLLAAPMLAGAALAYAAYRGPGGSLIHARPTAVAHR